MNLAVKQKIESYPDNIADLLNTIRNLILCTAEEYDITNIEETLKWGEPSYISTIGSAIRFDWKVKSPEHYFIYFNCKSRLIETFKEVYGDTFAYKGNRAIVFTLDQKLPLTELKHCISMALRYKKLKHLPLLGA